ncbi:putative licABCH operon regulator [compost metagenome]|uniref:BglG family transcription antiterminator n=1 Tax=Paenibacillus sp. J53TS2 TaxID=2807197 RepID=UPI000FA5B26B|nr:MULTISPECIES: PRD domain-containing protein [Paenibacillus]MUG87131.1 PRD domain-containing protein [Paenibacillus timonensis]GIP49137.1 transcriptional regulator ManR [Paenibacillus sp. J53TS2]
MNNRQKEIIHMLLNDTRPHLVVRDIALHFNCSEKTIRNDLDEINRDLAQVSNARLVRKPGFGVTLDMTEQDKSEIAAWLLQSTKSKEQETGEERLIAVAYQLLMETKPITIQELADKHYTSKSVIKKDLDSLREWLDKRDLSVVSKQKVGVLIEGKERDKRSALSKLSQLTGEAGQAFIKDRFAAHELDIVTRELKQLELDAQLAFTDEALDNLLIHTLLMIRRTKLKQPIKFSEQEKIIVREKPEFRRIGVFIRKLERLFAVRFPEDEAAYLTAHILGGKIRSRARIETAEPGTDPAAETAEARGLAETLIRKMSALTWVDFGKDEVLMEGLRIHLYSTLNRLSYGLTVSNPMLQDIKKMYPYMFDMVISATKELSVGYPFAIPEEEAAYLTLHFQAAVERLSQPAEEMKTVVTVCHMGVGMSQILRSKLERKFPELQVLDSVRKADLVGYLANHTVDFIISTIPLEHVNTPSITVSPLLEAGEVQKITDFIGKLDHESGHTDHAGSIISSYTQPSLVFPRLAINHRFELIELLANRLAEQGFVEQDYAHQALLRERLSSTTIGGGIAIPHGDPKLIRTSRIAVATLEEPLDWQEEKVSIVFMLALAPQEQEMMKKLFQRLSLLSEQPSTIERMVRAETPEELLGSL